MPLCEKCGVRVGRGISMHERYCKGKENLDNVVGRPLVYACPLCGSSLVFRPGRPGDILTRSIPDRVGCSFDKCDLTVKDLAARGDYPVILNTLRRQYYQGQLKKEENQPNSFWAGLKAELTDF